MMRGFSIGLCVLSIIYILASLNFINAEGDARNREWATRSEYYNNSFYDEYTDPYSYTTSYEADGYEEEANDITRTAGIVSILFMLISAVVFLLALVRIKTTTMKVIAIIGLSISGLFMLWGFLPMTSPGGVSFSEVGPAFVIAATVVLAFHIVGVVQAFKTSA
jgi:hypothetical protein